MKVMIPVRSDTDGRLVEVLKADGETVEYGERLFALSVEPATEGPS
jgi:biotin carboxyl carrier protein